MKSCDVDNIQIVTGIEVNGDVYFPRLRVNNLQLWEINLTIDRWRQSLFVLLYGWSKLNEPISNRPVIYWPGWSINFINWPPWSINDSVSLRIVSSEIYSYTTWHDLNQWQPCISTSRITKLFSFPAGSSGKTSIMRSVNNSYEHQSLTRSCNGRHFSSRWWIDVLLFIALIHWLFVKAFPERGHQDDR